jgi:protoporphyrinogen oxidase
MISLQSKLEELAKQLAGVLDMDIENLKKTIDILDQLRAKIIKRDEHGLEELLNLVESQQDWRAANETRREQIRMKAARVLGCRTEQVNLSKLISTLYGRQSNELAQKQRTLSSLVSRLRAEFISTVSLVGECSRLNKLMLNAIMNGRNRQNSTYNASGVTQNQDRSGLVNMQF